MTRIERLPSVVANGLLSDNACRTAGISGIEIGYPHIKQRRARRHLPIRPGGTLADYVPFYFAPRSPMLYAIGGGALGAEAAKVDRIAYLVTSTQRLRAAGLTVLASNRHAELAYAEFTDDDDDLDSDAFIDWPLMKEVYWFNTAEDPDRKERRQAECLVHPAVRWRLFEGVVVRSRQAQAEADRLLQDAGSALMSSVRPGWYF